MKITPAPDCDDDNAAAAMFARIAALSPPALPPGFAERIVRDVPRLAQMPSPARLPIRGALRAAPLVRVVASQQARGTSLRRPIAAWSALAAGIAAVALMLPSAFAARSGPAQPVGPVRQAAVAPQPQMALVQMTDAPRLATPSPATHSVRARFLSAPTPVTPDTDAAAIAPEPVAQPAPLPGVIAVAVAAPVGIQPSRPVYGPVDTEAASSGAHGGIGSGQTPGYAFVGGASGAHP